MSQVTCASVLAPSCAVVVRRNALIVIIDPAAPAFMPTLTSGVTSVPGGKGPGWPIVNMSVGPTAAVFGVGSPLMVAVPGFWIALPSKGAAWAWYDNVRFL